MRLDRSALSPLLWIAMRNIETLSKFSDQCTLRTALTVTRASCIGGISGEVYLNDLIRRTVPRYKAGGAGLGLRY